MKNIRKNGFTLVELSIVLVIIGLLVGGVLQGQELIKAAKRQSLISDISNFEIAMNSFELQYGGTPGDFKEASDYWGCTNCDGNGDGQIESTTPSYTSTFESSLLPLHFEKSEILPGNSYTGTYTGTWDSDVNTFEGAFNNSIYTIMSPPVWVELNNMRQYKAVLCMTKNKSAGSTSVSGCVGGVEGGLYDFYAKDAKAVDDKIDDGSARNGRMLADTCHKNTNNFGFNDTVIYKSTNTSLDYDLTDETYACGLMFLLKK